MSTRLSFLDLPGEVRNLIYAYAFVQADPIKISDKWHGLPLSLLRTNKTIHQESQSVLYGQNTFDFSDISDKRTAKFLDKIGQENAKWIENVHIAFPTIRQREDIEIESTSARVLDKLHDYCPKLNSITLGPEHNICGDGLYKKSYFACPGEIHAQMLRLIAMRLCEFSLQLNVTLKLYTGRDCTHLGEYIDDYGWGISYVKHPFDDGSGEVDLSDFVVDYEPGYFEPSFDEPDYSDDDFYPSENEYDDGYGFVSDDDSWREAANWGTCVEHTLSDSRI